MMTLRRAAVALVGFTVACSDATDPSSLTQSQVGDMLEAMTAVSEFGAEPGAMALARMGGEDNVAYATVTVTETVDCPNGGSASVNGTATDNPSQNSFTAQVAQNFNGCAGRSQAGRVWTFTGGITTNVSGSENPSTGAYTMTATQVGAIGWSSNLGSGNCEVDVTLTINGDANNFSASLNGTACGHNVSKSITVTQ